MADTMNNAENKADELDLLALFGNAISFFRTYRKLLLISTLVGVFVAVVIGFSLPKIYSSKLILHSNILTNTEQIEILDGWSDLIGKGEYNEVAADLNCTPGMLASVGRIEGQEIKGGTPTNPNGFIVEVLVSDTGILDVLQKSIVYGLENTDYVKERVAEKRANYTDLIKNVKIEIDKLDTIKRNIENSINNKSKNASSFLVDVTGVNASMVSLHEKLLNYQEELRFVNGVQVVKQFSKYKKPIGRKRMSLFVGLIGGFGIGYMLAVYKQLRRKLAVSKTRSSR